MHRGKDCSASLRLPFPVEIKAGTEISQSITLTLNGNIPEQTKEISKEEFEEVKKDLVS